MPSQKKYKSFFDIPSFTPWSGYLVDVSWGHFLKHLDRYITEHEAQLDPDFQRAHVWTEKQQIAYVEFCLRAGQSGNILHWNCPGWMGDFRGPMVLVDGKQRVQAITRFLTDEIPAFGQLRSEYKGNLIHIATKFHVNKLATRVQVLQWYLELNDGGVVHTKDELNKVRKLLEQEKGK